MKILCVIPSRIQSTRLPRKPLLLIQGKPMIQWVYENASKCPILTKVVVATDSEEIASIIKSHGGNVEMTNSDLQTGSDRVAVVAKKYNDMEIVINLQGDEPFIKPKMLEQLVAPYLDLATPPPEMTTLAYKLDMEKEYNDPRVVKVIIDLNGNAIYFSRSPIPYFKIPNNNVMLSYHHIGIYAFRREFLLHYTKLPQTPLEKAESLEQLRVLEHGYRIHVRLTKERTLDINDKKTLIEAQNFEFNL